MEMPYLTRNLPGIGGKIKTNVEDFRVEEIPLYALSGHGTHLYFEVTKSGLPTPMAVNRIARHMGVAPHEIGVAGLKDAQAVTTQIMSLEHADRRRLEAFRDTQVKVSIVDYHTNKLRPGLLAGNRFVIRIRGVGKAKMQPAKAILEVLTKRGVPNYFGSQRFGARGDTGRLGEAIVRDDLREFVALFLGRAIPADPPDCRAAREAFDAGYYDRAIKHWPRHYVDQRRALTAFKRKKSPRSALAGVDKRMKRLFVSAFQSELFNEVLVRRLESVDRVWVGDLAYKHDSGGVFKVEDLATDQLRASRFEISPTGPIFGFRSSLAEDEMGRIEREVLAAHNIDLEIFRNLGPLRVKGSRRPLRFAMDQPNISWGSDNRGDFLELAFTAPSGAYATVVLREIMKNEQAETEAAAPAEVEDED